MKENFFVRVWKRLRKFCKDTVGELKKVVWTSKTELSKNTKLVIATVVAVSVAIALVESDSEKNNINPRFFLYFDTNGKSFDLGVYGTMGMAGLGAAGVFHPCAS